MKIENASPQFERKKKFFVILPVFLVPFIAVFFFLLGGGKGAASPPGSRQSGVGFNTNLPAARLKDNKGETKLSFYEQADRDSALLKERLNNDPYYGRSTAVGAGKSNEQGAASVQSIQYNILRQHPELGPAVGQAGGAPGVAVKAGMDSNERKVYEKIQHLNESLAASGPGHDMPVGDSRQGIDGNSPRLQGDVDRLEGILMALKDSANGQSSSQMQQWNSMLDKIIAIQHPQNRDSIQRLSNQNKGKIYPVSASHGSGEEISLLERLDTGRNGAFNYPQRWQTEVIGFYGLDDRQQGGTQPTNVVTAAIDETQTVVSGSDIRLRLTSDLFVDGTLIPAGTPLTGLASLSGERLKVEISSIRYGTAIYSVALKIYDMDGVPGIYIPGSISRDVSKESADQALGEMNLMSMDPSVGAQAATAGIEAAKSLISKKIRLVRVTVKDAYQVFLKDGGN